MTTKKVEKSTFFPEGYKVPDKKKQFLKLKEGENQIRFLTPPLLGYIFYSEVDKKMKPVRRLFAEGDFSEEEMKKENAKVIDGQLEGSKHFWAAVVWDYTTNTPKVFEFTNSTIQRPIEDLAKNEKWGDPRNYDIIIKRTGSTKNDTEYSVIPNPKEEAGKDIKEFVLNSIQECDLDALIAGEYPFKSYSYE